jgi:hypothetical protein
MRRFNLTLAIILLLGFAGICQDKSHVAFCDFKSDTLTYEQFKNCSEIKILSDPQMEVTFFTLVCRIGKNDILEHNGTGNSLKESIRERMISGGVTEFWLEKMIAKKGDAKVEIGTRKFFLTK